MDPSMYWFHEIVGKVHVTYEDVHAVDVNSTALEADEMLSVPV